MRRIAADVGAALGLVLVVVGAPWALASWGKAGDLARIDWAHASRCATTAGCCSACCRSSGGWHGWSSSSRSSWRSAGRGGRPAARPTGTSSPSAAGDARPGPAAPPGPGARGQRGDRCGRADAASPAGASRHPYRDRDRSCRAGRAPGLHRSRTLRAFAERAGHLRPRQDRREAAADVEAARRPAVDDLRSLASRYYGDASRSGSSSRTRTVTCSGPGRPAYGLEAGHPRGRGPGRHLRGRRRPRRLPLDARGPVPGRRRPFARDLRAERRRRGRPGRDRHRLAPQAAHRRRSGRRTGDRSGEYGIGAESDGRVRHEERGCHDRQHHRAHAGRRARGSGGLGARTCAVPRDQPTESAAAPTADPEAGQLGRPPLRVAGAGDGHRRHGRRRDGARPWCAQSIAGATSSWPCGLWVAGSRSRRPTPCASSPLGVFSWG